jgi:dipeptidyl aminopeptidase/acylaminoacyl peptidase
MTVAAPPKPPTPSEVEGRPEVDLLEALIEEARQRARRRRLRYAACLVAASAVAVAVFASGHGGWGDAGSAERGSTAPVSEPRGIVRSNGPLTIIGGAGISTIGRGGRLTPLFGCLPSRGCYDLESIAWSPDGRRLAFSVTTVGAVSAYNGLHVYDTATGRDRQFSFPDGFSLAWSPDGSRIAYVESSHFSFPWGSIFVVDADGSHRRLVDTGTSGADMSPSWSPEGKRLVFATTANPYVERVTDASVSIVDVDGSHRRLLVEHASAPAWSPDGTRIAYHAGCGGIRLITPAGADATPESPTFGCRGSTPVRRGRPVWSPDNRKLAVANALGVFVIDLRTRTTELVTPFGSRETGLGLFRTAQPSWRAAS